MNDNLYCLYYNNSEKYTREVCMELKELVTETIQKTGHQPFLFVGSGFSRRYMNTEKWDELLKVFCEEYSGSDF